MRVLHRIGRWMSERKIFVDCYPNKFFLLRSSAKTSESIEFDMLSADLISGSSARKNILVALSWPMFDGTVGLPRRCHSLIVCKDFSTSVLFGSIVKANS